MMVMWPVDDPKVSHMKFFEVTKFAKYLSTIYTEKLTLHRGKLYDYIEIDLDYLEPGVAKVLMTISLNKVIYERPEDLRGTSSMPE